jgi:hypothetical protein
MVYTQTLYETDFVQWLDRTAQLLKERRFDELELEKLVEEIEALNQSEKQVLESSLESLLIHLLKWHYQPGHRARMWQVTIQEQRQQIAKLLKDSPSLKNYILNRYKACYMRARQQADKETVIFLQTFPEECPYSMADILNPGFFPVAA